MLKVCPKCGEEKNGRGFLWHVKYCKGTLKVRYPKQKARMTPEQYEKYLRKVGVA